MNDEQKQSVESPKQRLKIRRWLRCATLAMLGVLFCLTLVFWIRSYWRIDHLHGILWGEQRLFVRSGGGEIVFSGYTLINPGNYPDTSQSWQIRSYEREKFIANPSDFETHIAISIQSQSDSGRPVRFWWNDPPQKPIQPPFMTSFYPNISSHGIAFPHLLLLVIIGSLFFLILRRWQFSLRVFLIWVTIICIAMACAVALTNAVKEVSVYHNYNMYIF